MLSLTVKVGQTVKVGDGLYIKVEEKRGRRVRMGFQTELSPIKLIGTEPDENSDNESFK